MSSKNMHLTPLFVKAEKSELDELRSEYGKLRKTLDNKDKEIARLKKGDWGDREIERAKAELAAAYREMAAMVRSEAFLTRCEFSRKREREYVGQLFMQGRG